MARRTNLENTRSLKKLLIDSFTAESGVFDSVDKDQGGGAGAHIAKQRSQNNYNWREKNGADEIRAKSTHNSDGPASGFAIRINTIENVESQTAFDKFQGDMLLKETEDLQCQCLEKLHLKIESELDRLRGLFRKREQEMFHPLSYRLQSIEERIDRIEQESDMKFKDHQQAMLMQESTIEIVIKALQSIKMTSQIKLDHEEMARMFPPSNVEDSRQTLNEEALQALKQSVESKLKSSPRKLISSKSNSKSPKILKVSKKVVANNRYPLKTEPSNGSLSNQMLIEFKGDEDQQLLKANESPYFPDSMDNFKLTLQKTMPIAQQTLRQISFINDDGNNDDRIPQMLIDLNHIDQPNVLVTDLFQYQTPSENSRSVNLDSHLFRESKVYEEALKMTPQTHQKINKTAFHLQ